MYMTCVLSDRYEPKEWTPAVTTATCISRDCFGLADFLQHENYIAKKLAPRRRSSFACFDSQGNPSRAFMFAFGKFAVSISPVSWKH